MKTHYAIIGPRRSGTTFCFRSVRDFSSDFASKLQDEFFNTYLGWFGVKDGIRLQTDYDRKYLPHTEEIKFRINLLKKHNCAYTIKIVADHLSPKIIDFIIENYKIIIIERQNKYEQYLSFLISEHTNTWGCQKVFEEYLTPMEIPIELTNMFFQYEKQWQIDKKLLTPYANHLIYEDFIKNYKECLEKIGIQTKEHSIHYRPVFKMRDLNQKERLITNIKQIKMIYEENLSHGNSI